MPSLTASRVKIRNVRTSIAKTRICVLTCGLTVILPVFPLDLSGAGLHLRGYRDRTGMAPIKETTAAAIVMRSGWQPGTPLLDPMCGSGTLLIEAAMLATDRARGVHRGHWGFGGWAQHDEAIWQEVKAEAQTRARKGLAEYTSHFYGSDSDPRVIERARSNARRAGIGELVTFEVKDVANLTNPLPKGPYGTVISNPPYGEASR